MNNKQEVLPVNSKSKDRLFHKIYESEESRKNLARFLLGKDFTDARLENTKPVIFGNKENDLAFILDDALYVMIEEQSYFCANIAYRILEYIVAALRSTVDSEKILYGRNLVSFPMPKLYAVNVGLVTDNQKTENIFYDILLEDSFVRGSLSFESDLNLTVHIIDFRMTPTEILDYIEAETLPKRLNGYSDELFQYALTANCLTYVQACLRDNSKHKKPKNINSVAQILELLKGRGILCQLLQKKEVFDMTMATFSRDDILIYQGRELGREEGIEEGIEKGRKEGIEKGIEKGILSVICNFLQNGGTKETAKQLLGVSEEQIQAALSMQMQVAK